MSIHPISKQSDYHVKLVPVSPPSDITERFTAAHTYLTPALLTKLRTYITVIQHVEYTLSDDMQKVKVTVKVIDIKFVCLGLTSLLNI